MSRVDEGSTENIASWLRAHARSHPSKPALVFPTGKKGGGAPSFSERTYSAVEVRSDAIGRGFRELGITRGTRVIVMIPPGPDLIEVVFGLFKIGAVPVIVDPGMGAKRMLHCYKTVGAEAFIGVPLAHALRVARPNTFRSVKIAVSVGRPAIGKAVTLDDIAMEADAPLELESMAGDDTIVLNFTTGSTGPARGVVYTHDGVVSTVRKLPNLYGDVSSAVTLVTLPLFALFDVLLGVTAVLAPMKPNQPASVDAGLMVQTIARFEANTMFASPAFLHRVASYGSTTGASLPTLRLVVAGGAPVMPGILKRFRTMLPGHARLMSVYGATEALPIATIDATELLDDTAAQTAEGFGTCAGRAFGDVEARVMAIQDSAIARWNERLQLPAGEVGEIVIRGPSVSPAYEADDAANLATKVAADDGLAWHRTGDLGWIDAEGRLWFCGRKAQRVPTRAGELYTVPAEGVFNAHPAVYRSALVGIPNASPHGGNAFVKPVVCVELHERLPKADMERLEEELTRLAESHPSTRGIDTFLFHPNLPVDIRHNAKIQREELAEWAARQLGVLSSTGTREAGGGRMLPVDWLKAVPIAGWIYLAIGFLFPFASPLLRALWWVDAILSIGAHGLQLIVAIPVGRRAGYPVGWTIANTILYGATWWKNLDARELRGRFPIVASPVKGS